MNSKRFPATQRLVRGLVFGASALAVSGLLYAQRGGGDWMTYGYDAQRSFWLRGDGKITPASAQKPGFELLWKMKFNNDARQLNSITPPALLDFYISYRGFRTLGFFGGASDKVIAVDTDIARLEWERALAAKPLPKSGTPMCPGGMTSAITRPTFSGYPAPVGLRGFGRANPARSGVGEPNEGAVTLRQAPSQLPGPPPPTKAGRRTAPAANPFSRNPLFVLAITGDGMLHSMYVSNGEEPKPAVPFLPANANATGLIAFDNTAYAATINGCGGVPNGIWAIDLETKAVATWKSGGSNIGGFAAGPDGTLFVSAGGKLVALEPGTLKEKGAYSAGSQTFTSMPVVFELKGKDLVAAAANDGRIHLIDGASLSEVGKSAPFSAPDFAIPALASWQDDAGARWLLSPAGGNVAAGAGFAANGDAKNGSVVAFKVTESGLQPAWASRDLTSPLPPTIVNGVVFAVSGGVKQRSGRAVLYALDPATGKEWWNSGAAITSFVHSGGLAAGGGRVYVSSHDGTQYAFGIPMEH